MPEDVEEVVEEQVVDAGDDEAAQFAAMEEGFLHDEPIGALPEETPTAEAHADESGETPALEPAETTPAAAPELTYEEKMGKRLAEIEAAFTHKIDTAFGKMGGLERTLREVKEASGRQPSLSGKWTAEDFKSLHEEFPEITEHIVAGVNAGLGRLAATPEKKDPTATPVLDPDRYVTQEHLATWKEQEAARIKQENATDIMDSLKPSWREVVGGADDQTPYRQWLATQPEAYQQELASTWKPGVILKSIEQFETFTKANAKKPEPPKPKPGEARRAIVRAAVPTQGTAHAEKTKVLSEEEAMLQEFHA